MQGKVVFITGVSSGIGRASALAFARQGANVVGVARRAQRLAALEAEINLLPGSFLGLSADVTDAEALQSAVVQTIARFGSLDILVANAGIGQRGSLIDAPWEDIDAVLRTNIDGVLHSIRAAVPAMRQSGGGHIITISSVVYNLTAPFTSTYAASKAFVTSVSHSLRVELETENIRVTDVLVGRTETEFNEKRRGAGKRAGGGKLVPVMTAEQVAQAVVKAAQGNKRTVIVRFFDRLLIWGSILAPGIIGQLAKRQYR